MTGLRKKEINLINKMIKCYWNENNATHLDNEKDYDLTKKLVKKLTIPVVSNQRELLIGYIMNEQRLYCGMPDRELSEQLADDYIANL